MLLDASRGRHSAARFKLPPDREAEAVVIGHKMPPPKKVGPYALKVRVNHGRWIVDCPACGSAQLASRTDRRFFCVECANVAFDGDWVAVEWPKQEAAIERALKKRTLPQNRNWEPGETVADLQDEIFMDDALIAQIRAQAGGGGD